MNIFPQKKKTNHGMNMFDILADTTYTETALMNWIYRCSINQTHAIKYAYKTNFKIGQHIVH